jgi:enoyl-CoA hydratase/carnithine racemase
MSDNGTAIIRYQDRVTAEERDGVLLIGLDRQAKLNGFDRALFLALGEALTHAEDDPNIRCALIFANGKCFTAGVDLADIVPIWSKGEAVLPATIVDPWQVSATRVRAKPVVLAVHGLCYTLGIELALACDVVIASEDTRFGQLEVKRGIMPILGATMRFPKAAGWGNAMRYMLTGDEFDAQEALRMKIVAQVVPRETLMEEALAIAQRIQKQAPLAVEATIASSQQSVASGFEGARQNILPQLDTLLKTEDAQEGLRSMIERRPGQFKRS